MIQDLEFNCSGREKNKIMFRVIKSPFHKPLYLCLSSREFQCAWMLVCILQFRATACTGTGTQRGSQSSRSIPLAQHRGAWHHNQPLCNWGKYLAFSVRCWMLTSHRHTHPSLPLTLDIAREQFQTLTHKTDQWQTLHREGRTFKNKNPTP